MILFMSSKQQPEIKKKREKKEVESTIRSRVLSVSHDMYIHTHEKTEESNEKEKNKRATKMESAGGNRLKIRMLLDCLCSNNNLST